MTSSSSPSPRRLDLQGVRGLAIIAVVLFHFFPHHFPNGYVGVDQFFVLSGYLISMVFKKEGSINVASIKEFYYRRVRRIVPLYLLLVFFVLIGLVTVFPKSNLKTNLDSAFYALLFLSNAQGDDPSKAYKIQLNLAKDVFTHTWSLAVEMQFYLLVPFIFFCLQKTPHPTRKWFLILLALSSFTYHIRASEYQSFNSILARIWQFVIDCTPSTEHDKVYRGLTSISVPILCFILFWKNSIEKTIARSIVSLITAAIMISGTEYKSPILSNVILSYFGDISYSLYLVHWPIYTFVKLNYATHDMELFGGVLLSLMVSAILTETYEKFYLTLSKIGTTILCTLLYILCVVLFYLCLQVNASRHAKLGTAARGGDAIAINTLYGMEDPLRFPYCDYPDKQGWEGFCDFQNVNKSASLSIMIIGNSWAPTNAPPIYEYCRKKANNITMYSAPTCDGFKKMWGPKCDYVDKIEKVRPDVLFVIIRHFTLRSPLADDKTDTILPKALTVLKQYERLVKKKISS